MRRALIPLLCATLAGANVAAGVAQAEVTVSAGQALQLKGETYGAEAVDGLTHDLARTVGEALQRTSGFTAPRQVQLVLQDASPSGLITPSRAAGGQNEIDQGGINLGGAWIDGFVIGPDGKKTPLGLSFYQASVSPGAHPAMWSDAHHAFSMLASDLARGHVPQSAAPGAPPKTAQAHYPQ